jgi:hypothetical protein
MAVDTFARNARKLKSLAADAVSIPDTQTLYQRKIDEIASIKSQLDRVVDHIISAEKQQPSARGNYPGLLASRLDLRAKLGRLQTDAGLLKEQIIASRPKAPLTPQRQMWVDALPTPPVSPYSKAEMAEAQAELDRVVHEMKLSKFNGDHRAEEALMPAYREAKLKLAVMQGGYRGEWPGRFAAYATREDMAAALKKWKK